MAFKQPRIPEYRDGEGMEAYIRTLTLFLKDFCTDAWTADRAREKAIGEMAKKLESLTAQAQSDEM